MPEQYYHFVQIHLGHNQSTGRGMAVAIPDGPGTFRLFECYRKLVTRPLQCLTPAE